MQYLKAFLLLAVVFTAVIAHPDEVTDLPGLNFTINYKHYSGYLNATSGRHLHYWFVESQRSPSTDPLLLWLNGGPGCSSLDGFLNELGPLHVTEDGKSLYRNPYSWNKEANVLFLEAPSGVGFSYADNKKYDTDDDATSYDNYVALQNFFVKFPQFKGNDFYITGESYGGIYIPTLSVRVLEGPAKINFKGFAIGNGYLNAQNLSNSIVFFAYYHGLVGPDVWSSLETNCCGGVASINTCNFYDNPSKKCQSAVNQVNVIVGNSGLNIYNLYADCAHSSSGGASRYSVDKRNIQRLLSKSLNNIQDDPPCTDATNVRNWLNQPSVRKALHIPSFVQDWDICSLDVEIGYQRIYDTMVPQILKLIGSGKLRGLIYNGDVDMACNFLGDEWFANELGLKVLKNYAPWTYNDQIGGFVKYYKNLSFLTIRGSGHMVPQDKPGPAFHMISSFLNDTPY